MSHHFDTPTAQEDPRLNVCDFYLFCGMPGTTVMAMTVNPDAGLSAPDTFREGTIYAFRFDLNGDRHEDVTFKVLFEAAKHSDSKTHSHLQTYQVRRATGDAAIAGADGDTVISGRMGLVAGPVAGVRSYAGLAPDLFAGDAAALGAFRHALFNEGRFDPTAFESHRNYFAKRNVTAIVLEVPSSLIGEGVVCGWATASLHGHAPEVQVSRWGLPLVTNLFMPDPQMKEQFNRTTPRDEQSPFVAQVDKVARQLAALAGSAADPAKHARQLCNRLFPTMLPYELGTAAEFSLAAFNGRALTDDVMDVILSMATNTALGDGVRPDRDRILDVFPYFGRPYTSTDQRDVAPVRRATRQMR
jgi:hypothetical protein